MACTYRAVKEELVAEMSCNIESLIESTNLYLAKREQLDEARRVQYQG
jgi:hypothetical protein